MLLRRYFLNDLYVNALMPIENRCTSVHFDHGSIVSQHNGGFFCPTCKRNWEQL